jgi:hypothetical protein
MEVNPAQQSKTSHNDDWDVFVPDDAYPNSLSPIHHHRHRKFTPSCFDVFAGLWVFLYERSFPGAQHDAQQSYLLDELRQSTDRLKVRKDELCKKLKTGVMEAKKVHAKGDPKAFRSKMMGVRRVRLQMERIETSIDKIETNIDEIINSDVTKDIIDSLRRSTLAMKGGIVPMGGVDGVQETMDELQAELQASQDVTDTIYRGLDGVGFANTEDDDATLVDELNSLLRDTGEEEVEVVESSSVFASKIPSPPSMTKRVAHHHAPDENGDALEQDASSLETPLQEG